MRSCSICSGGERHLHRPGPVEQRNREEVMSCVIYLVRHGIAAEPAAHSADSERPLTDEGTRKMIRAALGLKPVVVTR